MKINKFALLILVTQCYLQLGQAQQCDYNYNNGSLIMWEKDLKRTPEEIVNAQKSINKIEECIANTSDNFELGFLYHRLAQMQFSLNKSMLADTSSLKDPIKIRNIINPNSG